MDFNVDKYKLVLTGDGFKNIDFTKLSVWLPKNEAVHVTPHSAYYFVDQNFKLPKEACLYLIDQKVDANVLPDLHIDYFKLLVSDMDSTLITIECIDELAAWCGQGGRVKQITERAMEGELDFKASLIARVALLKGLAESELASVYAQKLTLMNGAQVLAKQIKESDIYFVLVSGGFGYFARKVAEILGVNEVYANELEVKDGVLTGNVVGQLIDAEAKRSILHKKRKLLNLSHSQVIAVGDGANDLLMLQEAGLGVAFCAKNSVKKQAKYQINYGGLDSIVNWFV